MEISPLISVIVPVYNVENYLHRCVDSILNQSYQKFEIVLVNDGSTDGSGSMCDHIAQCDDRIKVIHQQNKGLSGARNSGLKVCKGEYISFIDSDDWISKEMFEIMVKLAQEEKLKVVECDIIKRDKFIDHEPVNLRESIFLENREKALERIIVNKYFSVCRRIYARSLLKGMTFPEGKTSEDVYFTINVLKKIKALGYIKIPFYNYYVADTTSITRSNYSLKIYNNTIDSILYFQRQVDSFTNPKLTKFTKQLVFDIALYNYKSIFYNNHLDNDYNHRVRLKKLIVANFLFPVTISFEKIASRFLPIRVFGLLLTLNSKLNKN